MREDRTESREGNGRRKRIPLGMPQAKLTVPPKKGYVRRWMNDNPPGRLMNAENGGYQFVQDKKLHVGQSAESGDSDIGSRVSRIVGTKPDGSALRSYLMEIKQEFYEEDQHEKQAQVDLVDDAIRSGKLEGVNTEGQYQPRSGGIKMQTPRN